MTARHPFAGRLATEGGARKRPDAGLLVLLVFVLLAGCTSLSNTSECQSFTIANAAMSPTYNAGQLVVIDTQAYASASPKRGQVVIINDPQNRGQEMALRVIGLPGETIRLTATQTFINGRLLTEPFVLHRGTQQPMEVTLAANQYFLMGDDRPQSTDSRVFGPIARKDILAQIGTQNCPNS